MFEKKRVSRVDNLFLKTFTAWYCKNNDDFTINTRGFIESIFVQQYCIVQYNLFTLSVYEVEIVVESGTSIMEFSRDNKNY